MRALTATLALLLFVAGCATEKRGEAYVKAHPELDDETKRRILAGEAFKGMTSEEITASIGGPEMIRRVAGGTDYWEYRAAILVFQDGILVDWIDKKVLYR